jgi:NADH-quinone oxidoreductase subunit A
LDFAENLANSTIDGAKAGMLENYLPIFVFLLVGILFGIFFLVLGFLLAPRKPDAEKLSPYECGFEAFEDARSRFDVRYYLVAILFIIFDLEIAFLFPWAVSLREIGLFGFLSMMLFLGLLVVGFIYEWKKGALQWE